MEETRDQLYRKGGYDEQRAKEILLDMCDKSINPEYKPNVHVDIRLNVENIMSDAGEARRFVKWMNKRGYIQVVNDEWIIISSMVENRKGHFYVYAEMLEAFWLDCLL